MLLLKFDNVLDLQRKFIYELRRKILDTNEPSGELNIIFNNVLTKAMDQFLPANKKRKNWDFEGFKTFLLSIGIHLEEANLGFLEYRDREHIKQRYLNQIKKCLSSHNIPGKVIILSEIDKYWQEHLTNIDFLWEKIFLGNIQYDKIDWFIKECDMAFIEMIRRAEIAITRTCVEWHNKIGNDRENDVR